MNDVFVQTVSICVLLVVLSVGVWAGHRYSAMGRIRRSHPYRRAIDDPNTRTEHAGG